MGLDRVTEMAHVTKLLCLIKEISNNNHSWLWGFLKGGFEYRQRIKISKLIDTDNDDAFQDRVLP